MGAGVQRWWREVPARPARRARRGNPGISVYRFVGDDPQMARKHWYRLRMAVIRWIRATRWVRTLLIRLHLVEPGAFVSYRFSFVVGPSPRNVENLRFRKIGLDKRTDF